MRKIRQKYQDLASKAAKFKEALDQAPGRVAEMRQMLHETVGDFQEIKDEFRISSTAFPEVIEQITEGAHILDETGYSLDRIDMDMGVNAKLVVHLDREEETSLRTLEKLQKEHQSNVAWRSLLAALIKGEAMAEKVDIPGMTYSTLAVEIGVMPCVRLTWLTDAGESETIAAPPPLPGVNPGGQPPPAQSASTSPSPFGQSSFFERRPPTQPVNEPVLAPSIPPTPPAPTPLPPVQAATPAPVVLPVKLPASVDPLARFKKMPDLTKPR